MTAEEIQIEKTYRIEERLALLCGEKEPSPEQLQMAFDEADQWEIDYVGNHQDCMGR